MWPPLNLRTIPEGAFAWSQRSRPVTSTAWDGPQIFAQGIQAQVAGPENESWNGVPDMHPNQNWGIANDWSNPGVKKKPENSRPEGGFGGRKKLSKRSPDYNWNAPDLSVPQYREPPSPPPAPAPPSASSLRRGARNKTYRTHTGPSNGNSSSSAENSDSNISNPSAPETHITTPSLQPDLQEEDNTFQAAPLPGQLDAQSQPVKKYWEDNRECDADSRLPQQISNGSGPNFTVGELTQQSAYTARFHEAQLAAQASKPHKAAPFVTVILNNNDLLFDLLDEQVRHHRPILVSILFQVGATGTNYGHKPTFALLNVCKDLYAMKPTVHRRWLQSNTFIVDLRDLQDRDVIARRWESLTCALDDCSSNDCVFAPGTALARQSCMRKPFTFVTSLYLRRSTCVLNDVALIARAILPFPNLKVLGFDLRGARPGEDLAEGVWFESDAPAYLAASVQAIYAFYGKPVPEGLRVRVATESREKAEWFMEAEGRIPWMSRLWNLTTVPLTEQEVEDKAWDSSIDFPEGVPTDNHNLVVVDNGVEYEM